MSFRLYAESDQRLRRGRNVVGNQGDGVLTAHAAIVGKLASVALRVLRRRGCDIRPCTPVRAIEPSGLCGQRDTTRSLARTRARRS